MPEFPELTAKVNTWPEQVRQLVVDDPESYNRAGQLLTGIKALLKEVEASCAPVIKAAHLAHRAATAQRRALETPLLDAERFLKGMMAEYLRAQQRIREEAWEKHLDAELAKHRAQREQEIAALRAAGDTQLADAMADAPLGAFPSSPDDIPPPTDGISVRKIYRAEVIDFAILVRSVHEGRVPLKVLLPNMGVLNNLARNLGPTFNCPGVVVREDVSISARALES